MIYKVISDFKNLPEVLEKLDKYNIAFINDSLYISDVKQTNTKRMEKFVKSLFDTSNLYLVRIDRKNFEYEAPNAKIWCEKQLVWSELIEFEEKQQKILQNTMAHLNKVEEILFNGGEEDAREKETG